MSLGSSHFYQVLIHQAPIEALDISPDLPAARNIFPATEIGQDGMGIDF
jgi:hypothetical protein